jgi:hypothetical protein
MKNYLLVLGFGVLSSLASAATTQYQFTTTSGFSASSYDSVNDVSRDTSDFVAAMGGIDYIDSLSSSGTFTYTSAYDESIIYTNTESQFMYDSIVNFGSTFDNQYFTNNSGFIGSINVGRSYLPPEVEGGDPVLNYWSNVLFVSANINEQYWTSQALLDTF